MTNRVLPFLRESKLIGVSQWDCFISGCNELRSNFKYARSKYYTKVSSGGIKEEKPITVGFVVNIDPATN